MGMAINWLAAGLLAFTIVFYAVVYTMWLKRWTAQNIVIGGLAGALPPAIGWAAATGHAPLNAWLMVLIIFLWTPPHFWALSLYISTDYAKAGVPMLPVVKRGAKETRKQVLLYSLVLIPVCLAPVFTGLGGGLYGVVSDRRRDRFLLRLARAALEGWRRRSRRAARKGAVLLFDLLSLRAVRRADRGPVRVAMRALPILWLIGGMLVLTPGLWSSVGTC